MPSQWKTSLLRQEGWICWYKFHIKFILVSGASILGAQSRNTEAFMNRVGRVMRHVDKSRNTLHANRSFATIPPIGT